MVEPDSENCEEYQGDLHNDVNLGKARVWHLLVEKILQDQEGEADGSSRNNLGKHNVNPDSWPLIQNTVVDSEEANKVTGEDTEDKGRGNRNCTTI